MGALSCFRFVCGILTLELSLIPVNLAVSLQGILLVSCDFGCSCYNCWICSLCVPIYVSVKDQWFEKSWYLWEKYSHQRICRASIAKKQEQEKELRQEKDKVHDMTAMCKAKAEAKAEEKTEKELAKARMDVAHEVRLAREAEAEMELHVAKAGQRVENARRTEAV
ncbi:hypothetical protein DKX38_007755 [Salix brachista]|uniref:Remorin C-terminal domain-containing protein n=1 Tax=Salix brachista TaxID=2182728 RepID=A0A5N5MRN1_9ROSI|nr:hypothetical protein DKX38_007755 [Salix brachista]